MLHRVDVTWERRDGRDTIISRGKSRVIVEARTEVKGMLIAAQMVGARKLHVLATDYVY